jgi:hypothetical protein
MCCFSGPVQSVADTKIFARMLNDARQVLVYSMKLSARQDLAMILPIPTPKGTAEDAVRFISLKDYANFFEDMEKGFPEPATQALAAPGREKKKDDAPKLKVIDVGSFEASFVPQVKDFARLDERIRLPTTTWDALPAYKDYGFAVFKLKKGEKKIHPMAFRFPLASRERLFFPTVHIHDGKVHKTATFDHALYCQPTGSEDLMTWQESDRPASMFMKVSRTAGLVLRNHHVYRLRLGGRRANRDTWLS